MPSLDVVPQMKKLVELQTTALVFVQPQNHTPTRLQIKLVLAEFSSETRLEQIAQFKGINDPVFASHSLKNLQQNFVLTAHLKPTSFSRLFHNLEIVIIHDEKIPFTSGKR